MFLATTALTKFWEPSQDTLFLSAGCLRYESRPAWQSLQYEVMECPWNDRQRFYDGSQYLDDCYERMLDRISQYLNTVLRVSYEDRYWRIIIGPWLDNYLHVTYDRYTLLSDAFSKYPELQTYTLDPKYFRTPKNVAEFTEMVCYDEYNLQLFSELMLAMSYSFPARAPEYDETQSPISVTSPSIKIRNAVKSVAKFGLSLVEGGLAGYFKKGAQIYLCNMNLPRRQAWAIALRTRMSAVPLPIKREWSFAIPRAEFNQRRNGLAGLDADVGFEAAFVQTLPQNFPSLYLEGYETAQAETIKKWPRVIPVLVSLNDWHSNEPFKFMAAKSAEQGSRLVSVQHGGSYGSGRSVPTEFLERNLSDSFMVWGWASKNGQSHSNVPSPVLSSLVSSQRTEATVAREGPIVMVTTAHPRFLLRFQSMPVGGQWVEYFDWRHRFLQELPLQMRRTILLRTGEKDYGWGVRRRTSDAFPEVGWDEGIPFHQRLKNSRILVADYPGTTFLESMKANVPTVLFWNPQQWENRDTATPYFEDLRGNGILWDSPEAAGSHTESIFADPWAWWGSQRIQQARQKFLERFGLGQKDWAKSWSDALREEGMSAKEMGGRNTRN